MFGDGWIGWLVKGGCGETVTESVWGGGVYVIVGIIRSSHSSSVPVRPRAPIISIQTNKRTNLEEADDGEALQLLLQGAFVVQGVIQRVL